MISRAVMVARPRPRPESPARPGAALHSSFVQHSLLSEVYLSRLIDWLHDFGSSQPFELIFRAPAERRQTKMRQTAAGTDLETCLSCFSELGLNTCNQGRFVALLPGVAFELGGVAIRHDAEFALVAPQALTWRQGEESSTDAQNKGMTCVSNPKPTLTHPGMSLHVPVGQPV